MLMMLLLALQETPSRVAVGEEVLYQDSYFDFDTGTALSRAQAGNVSADVQFIRQGKEWILAPVGRARISSLKYRALDEFEDTLDLAQASDKALGITRPFSMVGRTSEGKAFKAAVLLSWMIETAGQIRHWHSEVPFVQFHYAVQENGSVSLPGPVKDLRTRIEGSSVRVQWSGRGRHRVRWSGAASGTIDVDGAEAEIAKVAKDQLLRVVVTRITGDGGEGEPAPVTVLTSPAGVVRWTLRARPENHGFEINLRTGKIDSADSDWNPYFWGMRTPRGGGVIYVGEGEEEFESLRQLPSSGYSPRLERFDDNGVYAIRLRDGRYAKVWVKPTGDVRDELVAEIVFLPGGGRTITAGPSDLAATYGDPGVQLSWKRVADAKEYRVLVQIGEDWKEVGRTPKSAWTVPDAEKNAFLRYAVVWIAEDEARSDLSSIPVATFAAPFRVGAFTMETSGQSFDFSLERVVDGKEGDLFITNSAGGASALGIRGPHGIRSTIPGGFGKFATSDLRKLRQALKAGEIHTDDRTPASMSFQVRASGGGYAHVRIVSTDYPKVTFQYVFLPRLDLQGMIQEISAAAPKPTDAERADARRALDLLESESIEERDRAQQRLILLGPAGIGEITDAMKSAEGESKARLEAVVKALWDKLP